MRADRACLCLNTKKNICLGNFSPFEKMMPMAFPGPCYKWLLLSILRMLFLSNQINPIPTKCYILPLALPACRCKRTDSTKHLANHAGLQMKGRTVIALQERAPDVNREVWSHRAEPSVFIGSDFIQPLLPTNRLEDLTQWFPCGHEL